MTFLCVKSSKLRGRTFSRVLLAFLCCAFSVLVFLPHNARATTASDNFNRDDGGGPLNGETNPNWETSNAMNGTGVIYSNAVGVANDSTIYGADWTSNSFLADQFSQATFTNVSGLTATSQLQVGVRIAYKKSGGLQTGYYGGNDSDSGNYTIGRYVNSVGHTIAISSQAPVAGDVVRLEVRGITLMLFVNTIPILTVNDGSLKTGVPGFQLKLPYTQVGYLDDWSGGDLGGGVSVTSRSDMLSDSRPSATSNHAISFTTNTAISGSSTITLEFSATSTLSTLDCGDVDAATSSKFNFNYPGCAATATAWGFSVTGSVATLQAPTDSTSTVHVATGTPITIWIGSSATSQQQGIHWITNPSIAGIYTISVGGTFGGSGNILVSINSGVTVQATVAESLALTVSSVAAVNCTADDGASVTAIGTTSTTIPFGNVSFNTFYIGCQDLVISTNAGNGYSITTQESSVMKTANGSFAIPDTTCDAGGCTESAAAAWTTVTKNGLGHTCFNQDGNHDCDSSYSNGTKFRQFANIAAGETPQAIMASSTPASVTARIKHRLSAGAAQAAGAYTTLITYTIYATY